MGASFRGNRGPAHLIFNRISGGTEAVDMTKRVDRREQIAERPKLDTRAPRAHEADRSKGEAGNGQRAPIDWSGLH